MLHPLQEAYVEWLRENESSEELDYYLDLIGESVDALAPLVF